MNELINTDHVLVVGLGWGGHDLCEGPAPSQMYKGPHAYSHFLGKGDNFGPFVSGIFFREKPEKMGCFKPNSRDIGCFQKLPEK